MLAKGFFLLHRQPFLTLTAALHTILLTAKLMKTFLRGGYQYPISDFHAGIVGQLSSCRNEGQMGGIRAGQC